ncbi:MAG TPA: alpha/beta hydrolase [bacterium]|nr:alpha/beta hydrolase [bacterium]
MPFVLTDRGKFFYEEYRSEGPPVYLLHGLTAKHQDWSSTPDMLAKLGYHVFAFDMRGHGRTYWESRNEDEKGQDFTPEGHAKDLEACAKALGHSGLHVIGHSTGGRNALVFAALFPDLVRSLTVIDQTLTKDLESWKKYRDRRGEYPAPFADEKALDDFLRGKFPGDKLRFDYYKGQFWKKENGEWDWNFSSFGASETQRLGREKEGYPWLPQVKCPILYIQGGDSRYMEAGEREKIESLMTHGHFVVVEKAEHAVFRDNPEGFLRVLATFLKENG